MLCNIILLKRQPLKEFDEHLLCLNESGLLRLLAFGSRSPKSTRGKALSEMAWLEVKIEQKKSIKILKNIVNIHPIIAIDKFQHQNLDFYLAFGGLLKELSHFFPQPQLNILNLEEHPYQPEHSIYQLLRQLSSPALQQLSLSLNKLKLLFRLSLLKELGLLGTFNGCGGKQHNSLNSKKTQLSDEEYFFDEGEYFCKECLNSSKRKYQIKIRLKSLLLMNLFFKKYFLDEHFFIQFGQFLNSDKLTSHDLDELYQLSEEMIKLIKN